jgi:hypothetical protein
VIFSGTEPLREEGISDAEVDWAKEEVPNGHVPGSHVQLSDMQWILYVMENPRKKNEPDPKNRLYFIYQVNFGIGYIVDNILIFLF